MTPLTFRPLLKRIRWGGTRLGSVLGKPIGSESDYAESWELCDHGDDQSVVASGPWQGLTLRELMVTHRRELCGTERQLRQFPLLVKFLDASDRLSVQVHPNDVQARFFDPRENGKTEVWVILDARPDSRVYAGLKHGVDAFRLQQHLAAGTVEDCLHSYPARAGDCIFIPAGTVHAIGEGILLAEVQQSSDLTFRLHDWGRLGADGQPRPLHIEESLVCIDFDRGPVDPIIPRRLTLRGCDFSEPRPSGSGCFDVLQPHPHGRGSVLLPATVSEELVSTEFFTLHRHTLHESVRFPSDDRFHVLMVLGGCGRLSCDGIVVPLQTGSTLLLPASCSPVLVEPLGELILLDAFLETSEDRHSGTSEWSERNCETPKCQTPVIPLSPAVLVEQPQRSRSATEDHKI
ncbi:MAG: type I phosphomannose isomerase catalytic subunit [Planctomycetaceae bacterium]